jgi:hypothetical protein
MVTQESTRIRFLLDSIKTDKFDSVKTCIMSDAGLRNNFDACVSYTVPRFH